MEMNLQWHGPYAWPGIPNEVNIPRLEDSKLASQSGVYLWTVPHGDGYLIYSAGQTQRSFLVQHSRTYRDGFFTIFDMAILRNGQRKEIWHGHFGKTLAPERLTDFEGRRHEIISAAEKQLRGYRIFVGSLPKDRRLLARIEAGVMDALYEAPSPRYLST